MNPTTAAALIGACSAIAGGLVVSLFNLWSADAQRKFEGVQRDLDRRAATDSELRDKRIDAHLTLLAALRDELLLDFDTQEQRAQPRMLSAELTAVRLLSAPEVSSLAERAVNAAWRAWKTARRARENLMKAEHREKLTLETPLPKNFTTLAIDEFKAGRQRYGQASFEASQAVVDYREAAQAEVVSSRIAQSLNTDEPSSRG